MAIKRSKQNKNNSSFMDIPRLLWRRKIARIAIIYIGLIFLMAIVSFFWTPGDFQLNDIASRRQGPSWQHWFGTDLLGRDVFSRVMYASRITMILTVFTIFGFGLPIATAAGIIPSFYGKKIDFAVQRTGEGLGAIPPLFLILILTATVRPRYDDFLFNLGPVGEGMVRTGIADIVIILAVTAFISWIGPARMFRSMTLEFREAAFVERAKMLGASRPRIILRHVLPQMYTFLANAGISLIIGVVGTELALSFLGIGIKQPYPSFGGMFAETARGGSSLLKAEPHLVLLPGLVIVLYLFAFHFLSIYITRIFSSAHERGA